nr:MAG TPA: hypothetical protein [Caudoviricetes sp.]
MRFFTWNEPWERGIPPANGVLKALEGHTYGVRRT